MAKLNAPADCGGVSVAGVEYVPDGNGQVEIEDEAMAAHLVASFGFQYTPDPDPRRAPKYRGKSPADA